MSTPLRIIVFLLLAAVGVSSLMLAGLYYFQERLLFHPDALPSDYQFPAGDPLEERWIETPEGRIHTLLFRANPSRGVILYFHGNAGSLGSWGGIGAEMVKRLGWDVWMIDYPGYGKSPGRIRSEDQLQTIAEAWYEAARKEYPQMKIALFGRSIGSGMAVRLAAEKGCDALVLETPYLSISELAKEHFPLVPGFLLRYPFRLDERIAKVNCPILVIHGTEDTLIPYRHGEGVKALAGDRASLLTIDRGQHNNLSAFGEFWIGLRDFLTRIQ